MDGFPGVIASDDDFGINGDGLMITETTITQFEGWDPEGTPEFVRARKAMQYASSIDDYVRIMLEGNNGGYANDWLLGDRKTGEIAQFELGLKATPRVAHEGRRTSPAPTGPATRGARARRARVRAGQQGDLAQRAPRALGAGRSTSTRAGST